MRQGGLILAAGRVRSNKTNTKKKNEIASHPKHTRFKMHFFSSGNFLWTSKLQPMGYDP